MRAVPAGRLNGAPHVRHRTQGQSRGGFEWAALVVPVDGEGNVAPLVRAAGLQQSCLGFRLSAGLPFPAPSLTSSFTPFLHLCRPCWRAITG
jgi:hypothetical protein